MVTFRQLEAIRRMISRRISKKAPRIRRISLSHTLFKKSSKARMGKGKGKFFKWFGYVYPGQVLFEFYARVRDKKKFILIFSALSSKTPFKIAITFFDFIFSYSLHTKQSST